MEKLFLLFLFVSLASYLNHIDGNTSLSHLITPSHRPSTVDTDETYGYWEPLHYVSYHLGMQTWEYCPEYAIRTYAFILPFLPLTLLTKVILHLDKLTVFLLLKNLIGLFFAVSARTFLRSIQKSFGPNVERLTFFLFLASPGIFFASTAYLPSAICSSLLMFAFAAWLEYNFVTSIFFGSLAVLWSGWPFVGVILLPIGLDMLYSTYAMQQRRSQKQINLSDRLTLVFRLIISGIAVVLATAGVALAIDSFMYGKL